MPATVDRPLAPIPQRAMPQGAASPEGSGALDPRLIKQEWLKCWMSPEYFVDSFCQLYDATEGNWQAFRLWPAQVVAMRAIHANPLTAILKARQLGLTWLVLAYILWLMLFKPVATVSVFSRRQEEADYLLGMERLKGMFYRLPAWMQFQVLVDNERHWQLSNGSVCRSFPTSAGDSYTATFAFADEFDLVEDQGKLIRAVKPTIDGGGKMVLLSRADKGRPQSEFKRIYRSANHKDSPWAAVFLPWFSRPGRTKEWYEAQKQDSLMRTGGLDDVHEQYPATEVEALSPRELDKRFPQAWLLECYEKMQPLAAHRGPAINDLEIYLLPERGVEYVVGGDPAEGNPTSDDSSLTVARKDTGEEVAALAGKFEPPVFADHIATMARYYNMAKVLPERNNHGHSVIAWLRDNAQDVTILSGSDGKDGWLTTSASKTAMYDNCATNLREGDATIHSTDTYLQLSSVDGAKLQAPDGEKDDRATSFVLSQQARAIGAWDYVPQTMEQSSAQVEVPGDAPYGYGGYGGYSVYNGQPPQYGRRGPFRG